MLVEVLLVLDASHAASSSRFALNARRATQLGQCAVRRTRVSRRSDLELHDACKNGAGRYGAPRFLRFARMQNPQWAVSRTSTSPSFSVIGFSALPTSAHGHGPGPAQRIA